MPGVCVFRVHVLNFVILNSFTGSSSLAVKWKDFVLDALTRHTLHVVSSTGSTGYTF